MGLFCLEGVIWPLHCVLIDEDWSKVGDALDAYSCKPSFAVLISPVISMDDAIVHKGSRTNLLGKREQDIALRNLFFLWKTSGW